MGKVYGILSLVFSLVSFGLSPFSYFYMPLVFRIISSFLIPGLGVAGLVCGIIGVIKDDGKGLAIAGLIISPIALANFFIGSFLSFWGITY